MQSLNSPFFSNTCGKIYPEKIVLASAYKETAYPVSNIKKLTFRKSFETTSFLFMLLPCALFILPRFLNSDETFIKYFLYAVGAVMLVLSIVMGKKKYSLNIYLADGSQRTVNVWEENTKEAKKFIAQANAVVSRKASVATQNSEATMHMITETSAA
jgi:hypothetical protein